MLYNIKYFIDVVNPILEKALKPLSDNSCFDMIRLLWRRIAQSGHIIFSKSGYLQRPNSGYTIEPKVVQGFAKGSDDDPCMMKKIPLPLSRRIFAAFAAGSGLPAKDPAATRKRLP